MPFIVIVSTVSVVVSVSVLGAVVIVVAIVTLVTCIYRCKRSKKYDVEEGNGKDKEDQDPNVTVTTTTTDLNTTLEPSESTKPNLKIDELSEAVSSPTTHINTGIQIMRCYVG